MHTLSLGQLSSALQQKEFTAQELTEHFIKRIETHQSLNAFIHTDFDGARRAAFHADELIKQGNIQPLTGIPLAHKDMFCTQTLPTTCGSKMLSQFQPPYDATIVKKLANAGCVVLGKTNMDEFGMGSANENSYFGPVNNPWNLDYVPGGSSGGSAAAIAASLAPFATGTDTGGSIRQPAAFCGISGLKPTYGLVSRFGMVAFASSLDQAGPMARNAEDLAIILQTMVGFDERDSTSINYSAPNYRNQINASCKGRRIGVPDYCFQEHVDSDIQQALDQAVHVFKDAGCEIVPIQLPLQSLWVPCYYLIACAEASSNLARYDGIRFGHRTKQSHNVLELIKRSRDEGFGIEVKRRILTGTYVLSSGYFDDYYVQAQKVRRMIKDELQQSFSNIDAILGPTTPTCAFKQQHYSSPTQKYLADVFTVCANLAGLPAISIPMGFSHNQLPLGLQLIGPHFSELLLLQLAHTYQSSTTWHLLRPEGFL